MKRPSPQALIAVAFVAVASCAVSILAPSMRAQERDKPSLSVGEFEKLRHMLNLKNQRWSTIPWKNTLPEARTQAAREKKPIFMVVNTGNCLGFV